MSQGEQRIVTQRSPIPSLTPAALIRGGRLVCENPVMVARELWHCSTLWWWHISTRIKTSRKNGGRRKQGGEEVFRGSRWDTKSAFNRERLRAVQSSHCKSETKHLAASEPVHTVLLSVKLTAADLVILTATLPPVRFIKTQKWHELNPHLSQGRVSGEHEG